MKRKLNVGSPTLDDLELVEFNPPENVLSTKNSYSAIQYKTPVKS